MNNVEQNDADRERQLDRIIADYACRVDAGEQVDRAELLRQYPHLADILQEHFADLAVAEAWRQPESSQIDTSVYRTIKTTTPLPLSPPIPPSPLTPEQRSGEERFGRYRIEKVLGEGAMGAVYLATDTKLKRRVALKIPKCNQDDPDLMQRFLREARAAATLNHRNICQVYDIANVGDCNYISMAYIEGAPLSSFTEGPKAQRPRAVAQLVYKLAVAMATANDNGIVHRDLKPANIMVDGEQEPVIMDFGLAAMTSSDENTRLTQAGVIIGTPAYMSPEQIDGDPDRIDGRSDMFSLGVIFYELLCGKLPFQGNTVTAVLSRIATTDPAPPSQHRDDLDPAFDSICLKMLAKQPNDRYADMREVAQALRDCLADCPSTERKGGPTPAVRVTRPQTSHNVWRRQLPKLALGMLGAMILLTVILVLHRPEGDVTIEVNDENLVVVIDDERIEFTDKKKKRSGKQRARVHRLSLKFPSGEIRFDDGQGAFLLDGHDILVTIGDVLMKSDQFEVTRNDETVIKVAITRRSVDAVPPIKVGFVRSFVGHTERVHQVLFTPDGSSLISSGHDGTVHIWDVDTAESVSKLLGHRGCVAFLALSRDGKTALSAGVDKTLRRWNLSTKSPIDKLELPRTVTGMALSPDGASALVTGEKGEVKLWDLRTRQARSLVGHTGMVRQPAYSQDGQYALTAGTNESFIRLWNTTSGTEASKLECTFGELVDTAFSPDGQHILSVETKSETLKSGVVRRRSVVNIWDLKAKETAQQTLEALTKLICAEFSPDGRFIVSGGSDGVVRLWDRHSGCELHRFPGHSGEIYSVAISSDGRFAVSSGIDTTIRLWRMPVYVNTGFHLTSNIGEEVHRITEHASRINSLRFSPDGRRLLSGDRAGIVRIWDVADGNEIGQLQDHESEVSAIAVSSDGRRVLTGSKDALLRMWDSKSYKEIRRFAGHSGNVFAVALSPDGQQAYSSGMDGTIRVWETATGNEIRRFDDSMLEPPFADNQGHWIRNLSISFDRGLAVTGGRGSIAHVWDIETGKVISRLTGHENQATAADFARDSAMVMSGSYDGTARLWDIETGKEHHILQGHVNAVHDVSLSADGSMALTGGNDRTARLWNTETGEEMFCFSGNKQTVMHRVYAVALSPDGKYAATSDGEIIHVWRARHDAPPLAISPFNAGQAEAHQEAWAEYRGLPIERTNSIGMSLRLIPPGGFIMGSSGPGSDSNERPTHPVRLSRPFLIGTYEVTVGQFRQFVEATGHKTEAETDGIGGSTMKPDSANVTRGPEINWRNWWEDQTDDHPVVNVSWNDADAFCRWLSEQEGLSYRLPTNAEYEYASRAGTSTRHPFGDQIEDLRAVANLRDKAFTDMFGPDEHAGSWDDGFALTAPVDSFPANNFGLHDMPGNVNELCRDWFGPYHSALQTDPQGPPIGTQRVLRGGFFAALPDRFVSSNRGSLRQSSRHCGYGFRVVCELDPDQKPGVDRKPATESLPPAPAAHGDANSP